MVTRRNEQVFSFQITNAHPSGRNFREDRTQSLHNAPDPVDVCRWQCWKGTGGRISADAERQAITHVLFPASAVGLAAEEITIADFLRECLMQSR